MSLVISLAACTPTDDVWKHVRETGILRVGMDASFLPFESIAAGGTLIGFDVDLGRELSRRLGPALSAASLTAKGVEAQFVANLPYDGLYDALTVGRVDVVISTLVVNPARMDDFAYSASYFDAGQVLVVRRRPPSVSRRGVGPYGTMPHARQPKPSDRWLSSGGTRFLCRSVSKPKERVSPEPLGFDTALSLAFQALLNRRYWCFRLFIPLG